MSLNQVSQDFISSLLSIIVSIVSPIISTIPPPTDSTVLPISGANSTNKAETFSINGTNFSLIKGTIFSFKRLNKTPPNTPDILVTTLAISNIAGITSFLRTSVIVPALLGEKKAVIALPNSTKTGLIPFITVMNIFILAGLNTALNKGYNLVAI